MQTFLPRSDFYCTTKFLNYVFFVLLKQSSKKQNDKCYELETIFECGVGMTMSRFFLLRILNVISGICSRQMAFSLITSKRRRTVLHYISKTGQLNQNHQGLTFQRRLLQSTFHEERLVEFTEIKCLQHLEEGSGQHT